MLHYFITPAVFIIDFFVKEHIEKTKQENEDEYIGKGKVIIRKHHNKGAAMNFMEKRQPLVAAVSAAMTILVSGAYTRAVMHKESTPCLVGFAMMLGGALSNTYDRLKRKYVVDYISFNVKWKKFSDMIFNLSDFCIAFGAILIMVFYKKK